MLGGLLGATFNATNAPSSSAAKNTELVGWPSFFSIVYVPSLGLIVTCSAPSCCGAVIGTVSETGWVGCSVGSGVSLTALSCGFRWSEA